MDWRFAAEIAFWLTVLVVPIIVDVVRIQRTSRLDEARRRARERSL
jgi:hypothetical protein